MLTTVSSEWSTDKGQSDPGSMIQLAPPVNETVGSDPPVSKTPGSDVGRQRDVRPRPDPRDRHRRREPPGRPSPDADSVRAASTRTTGAGTTGAGTTGAGTTGAAPTGAGATGAGAACAAGRPRTASASAASASARCSACGRDTSRARIAALVVTFIAAMKPLSQARRPVGQAVANDLVRRRPDADHRLGPAGRRVRRAPLGQLYAVAIAAGVCTVFFDVPKVK